MNNAAVDVHIQVFVWKCLHAKSLLSCPTLCDPVDCSPPGSSAYGILQARIVKWVALPFSRGSSWLMDWTGVSHIAGRFITHQATWEACPYPLAPRPHNLFADRRYQNLTRILRRTGNRAWCLGGKFNLGKKSFCERFHRLRTIKVSFSFRGMEWGPGFHCCRAGMQRQHCGFWWDPLRISWGEVEEENLKNVLGF